MKKGTLFTDGGARGNPGPAGYGALLFDERDLLLAFDGGYSSYGTNNHAEYSALLIGLKLAQKNGITDLECYLDSELVVKQLKGEYKVKDANIKSFHDKISKYLSDFSSCKFIHVPRSENKHADMLVNLILDIKAE
jgi:ribonuclease HI